MKGTSSFFPDFIFRGLRWIIGIVLVSLIGLLINSINNWFSDNSSFDNVITLISIIFCVILIYLVLAERENISEITSMKPELQKAIDTMDGKRLIINRRTEIVTIGAHSMEYSVEVDLTNNSDEHIDKFKIGWYAEGPGGGLANFKVFNNGNEVPSCDIGYIEAERTILEGNDSSGYDFDIFIPIGLPKGNGCISKCVQKETYSFDKLYKEERDFISTRTHYVTKQLTIIVQLDKEAAKDYNISEHKKGGSKDFEVTDDSGNSLTNYCERLRSISSFTKNKTCIEWTILDPMIDCQYRLYIELKKRHRYSLSKNRSKNE